MKNNKMNMVISIVIFLVVVAGLVFITINKKNSMNEEPKTANTPLEQQGVKVTVLKEGTGDAAKAGDAVSVNYTGSFVDGKVFDSNVDPKFTHVEPFKFQLGAGQVIQGWDIGVEGMKVGEVRKLEIAPEFAYGETGAGQGVIPPNATLIFQVELLGINK